jgi:hypothetical protein
MKSIGPIDVNAMLLKSSTQKSFVPCERAPARITKRASEVRNGLQTVEKMRATSVQTRGRMWSGCGWRGVGEGGACTSRPYALAQTDPFYRIAKEPG